MAEKAGGQAAGGIDESLKTPAPRKAQAVWPLGTISALEPSRVNPTPAVGKQVQTSSAREPLPFRRPTRSPRRQP